MKVSDEKAAEIADGMSQLPKFPCRYCRKEHEGYLDRSPHAGAGEIRDAD